MAIDWASWWNNFLNPPKVNTIYFVPTFEPQQYVYSPNNKGGLDKVELNIHYFATQATAEELLKRYCSNGFIKFFSFGGAGGPNFATAFELHLVWPNGKHVNAGMLAAYFANNPESKYPNVADNMVKKALKDEGVE